ncbi:transcription antitermination factor NusB [Virgibacillus sp. MSJ-26]|uniref:transcription antitermination factor NusB n=1 Tax=Virgibacillus sp. MSJ-26 TaxID=2841522 RepID=UPI001C10CCAC|nr:transcription antitermination factor NusB [Virgibacillus sp. MSJ-26]MBU5466358.1 transcription antitermination factor NusB [Virgibacillus sp. MSJ-26]
MKRHEAREKAFQTLFQIDINDIEPVIAINNILENDKNDAFLTYLVEGVINNKQSIDEAISEHLENWSLSRLASVERTVLRIATFEILCAEDIPENVSINEAVELANKFGEEKSGKFVNGVLSKIIPS